MNSLIEFQKCVEIFTKFYQHPLKMQPQFLADVVSQYPPLQEIKAVTIPNMKFDSDIYEKFDKIPHCAKDLSLCKVFFTKFYENPIVTFNEDDKTLSVTTPKSDTSTYYRVNTGYLFRTTKMCALLFNNEAKYKTKPMFVDNTSDSPLFLEFIAPASEQDVTTVFKIHLIQMKLLQNSQTTFKGATKYFTKRGVVTNFKSNSKIEITNEGYLDASKETQMPTDLEHVLIIPRKRTIGQFTPLYGKLGDEICNPSWEYNTENASFVYPHMTLNPKFIHKVNVQSNSKNGGFNGCFYEIEDYQLIVDAFKTLAKLNIHCRNIRERINAKSNLTKSEKLQYIQAIVMRSKNPKDFNELFANLPKTIEEFSEIDSEKINIIDRLSHQEKILRAASLKRIVEKEQQKKRKLEDDDDDDDNDVESDLPSKKVKLENNTEAELGDKVIQETSDKSFDDYMYLFI
ncbi:DhNV_072 [Dikerogammarus haemobaphes nudivirus]|nr:DhNV_072 [Dikerogammarus haemobaphes nudivirus]